MSTEDTGDAKELGADEWLDEMRVVAAALLQSPQAYGLKPDEVALFHKISIKLAHMFMVMDQQLTGGARPPRAWMKDVPNVGALPSSEMHKNLKAESEVVVQKMLEIIEVHVQATSKQTAKRLLELLGRLLTTLSLFTSESVRLACLNNLKPEDPAGARLALVHDADLKEGDKN